MSNINWGVEERSILAYIFRTFVMKLSACTSSRSERFPGENSPVNWDGHDSYSFVEPLVLQSNRLEIAMAGYPSGNL